MTILNSTRTFFLVLAQLSIFLSMNGAEAEDTNAADSVTQLQQQQKDDYAREQLKFQQEQNAVSAAFPDASFRNVKLPYSQRVDDLISRMSLAEKLQFVSCDNPPIPKYGIPRFTQYRECLHGIQYHLLVNSPEALANPKFEDEFRATVYPEPITMAASWDMPLIHNVSHEISDEARGALDGKGSSFFGPNINLFRDPRWGRGQETPGEDPYLNGRYAVAFITGLQGNDPEHPESLACAKHYVVHSGPEGERFFFNVNVDMHDLYDTYLPAFEAAAREARVGQFMTSYNAVNGVPVSLSPLLITQVLRKEWNFDGDIVTDAGALDYATTFFNFGTAVEDSALALNAGLDTDTGRWANDLGQAIKEGRTTEKELDRAVKHRLIMLFRLGRMDDPSLDPNGKISPAVVDSPAHRATALQIAREGIVLLKNEGPTLPLAKTMKSIALIGPMGDYEMLGNYEGKPSKAVTIAQGLAAKVGPTVAINSVAGTDKSNPAMPSDLHPVPLAWLTCSPTPASQHAAQGLWARYYDTRDAHTSIERDQRIETSTSFNLLSNQAPKRWMPRDFTADWEATITPTEDSVLILENEYRSKVSLVIDGSTVIQTRDWSSNSISNNGGQLLKARHAYQIEMQTTSPRFQLLVGHPVQLDFSKALEAVAKSDVVVLACGISNSFEDEFIDRLTTELPWDQVKLIEAVTNAAGSKPVVLVVSSGSSISMPWAAQHVPAILWCGAGGEEAGTAVAEVLYGDFNPSGRLPITFYTGDDQLPPIEDYRVTAGLGRTYRYFTGKPQWEFGYGLSYTHFTYSNLTLSTAQADPKSDVVVSAKIKNTGSVAGAEVCQLYLRHLASGQRTPLRSLQGFARVDLQPGEEKRVSFTLTPQQLSLVDDEGKRWVVPGEVKLHVGGDQDHGLDTSFMLTGDQVAPEYRFVPPEIQ